MLNKIITFLPQGDASIYRIYEQQKKKQIIPQNAVNKIQVTGNDRTANLVFQQIKFKLKKGGKEERGGSLAKKTPKRNICPPLKKKKKEKKGQAKLECLGMHA